MVVELDGYLPGLQLPASGRGSCWFATIEVEDWRARLSPGASRTAADREDSAEVTAASVGPTLPVAAATVAEVELGPPIAADATAVAIAAAGSAGHSCWRCFQLGLGTGRENPRPRCHCLERREHCAIRHPAR